MQLAVNTLAAINSALDKDQGAKWRGLLRETMPDSPDGYSTDNFPFRSHLGASLLGRQCSREIWYSFHWTTIPSFEGRMLRLFNRGHLEEPRMVALLRLIGAKVHQADANGKQFRIQGYRGHYGGSLDAVVEGIPDWPHTPLLTEFKTHNDASFKKLKELGVMGAKWEHFIQMQEYMGYYRLPAALYMAANKNDDALHMEIVMYDEAQRVRNLTKVITIVDATEPPKRINNSPGWHQCRFCDHKPVCHGTDVPARTCRSCAFVALADEGKWLCMHPRLDDFGSALSKEDQLAACPNYSLKPLFK